MSGGRRRALDSTVLNDAVATQGHDHPSLRQLLAFVVWANAGHPSQTSTGRDMGAVGAIWVGLIMVAGAAVADGFEPGGGRPGVSF